MLNTTAVKQYFYMKARQNYIANKKYINEQLKNKNTSSLIEVIENESTESVASSSAPTTTYIYIYIYMKVYLLY